MNGKTVTLIFIEYNLCIGGCVYINFNKFESHTFAIVNKRQIYNYFTFHAIGVYRGKGELTDSHFCLCSF